MSFALARPSTRTTSSFVPAWIPAAASSKGRYAPTWLPSLRPFSHTSARTFTDSKRMRQAAAPRALGSVNRSRYHCTRERLPFVV